MEVKLEDWSKQHSLDVEFLDERLISIKNEVEIYFVLSYRKNLFNQDLFLNLKEDEYLMADNIEDPEHFRFLFQFGKDWYWCPWKTKQDEEGEERYVMALNDFKYVGLSSKPNTTDTYLGIHSEYEILNSALNYKTAVKKAKFLGIKNLGICDENTLGGVLGFQKECRKSGIQPIIGETVLVGTKYLDENDIESAITKKVKLYCTSEKGWFNLLNINNKMNTEFKGHHIPTDFLLAHGEGLVCVIGYSDSPFDGLQDEDIYRKQLKVFQNSFDDVLFQFCSSEFSSDSHDSACLNNFKFYLNNFSEEAPFAIIEDTHYLENYEWECKVAVNDISKTVKMFSKNQYFKTSRNTRAKIKKFFEGSSWNVDDFIQLGEAGAERISEQCKFDIPMEGAKLPRFEVDGEMLDDEDAIEMLRMICESGFEEKVTNVYKDKAKVREYRKRLDKEFSVITGAGFADYFLIMWDTVNYASRNNYMIGTGRGSVGGSLLAYLIGITRIDPIKYDLLFERFLNEARIEPEKIVTLIDHEGNREDIAYGNDVELKDGTKVKAEELKPDEDNFKTVEHGERKRGDSLPDIDTDFTTASRDIVKKYLKEKYGNDYTCSVGTYGRLKLRQTFKDLGKIEGIPFDVRNELTKKIDNQHEYEFFDIFKYAKRDPKLYAFIQSHPDMINKLKVILNNPKSVSIHPSAVLVLPKQDMQSRDRSLDDWIPVRNIDGMNISEWEGKFCDEFGILKNDILGLAQLDKFTYCLKLIEDNHGEVIDLDEVDYEDSKTYRLFQNGFNEDVFQFGSTGLKHYSKEVKPDCLDDLIAMAALYRPGPMSSNSHTNYAKIKHGKLEPEYDPLLKDVTEATNGLYVYQEQIMKVFVEVGFSLVESDKVRTMMKKFDAKAMAGVKNKFFDLYSAKLDGDTKTAGEVFDKLVGFSAYGFNKSHSAAYGLIAYQSQWLKANYPLEFWTTTLNFGSEDDIPYILKEFDAVKRKFKKFSELSITSADINLSSSQFGCDKNNKNITWSLEKIKGVGEKVVHAIIDSRRAVGKFESLEHFLDSVPKRNANKTVVTRLILAGAFDTLEEIDEPTERASLLMRFYDHREVKEADIEKCKFLFDSDRDSNWKWRTWEKQFTGFGTIDYASLLRNSDAPKKFHSRFIDSIEFQDTEFYNMTGWDYSKLPMKVVCGTLRDFQERESKNGKEFLNLWIDSNSVDIKVTLWGKEGELDWEHLKSFLGKIVMVSGGACSHPQFGNSMYLNSSIKGEPYIQEI